MAGSSLMKSIDKRNLPVPPGGREAMASMIDYVSERSVALIMAMSNSRVFVGSATCIRIGGVFLLATAAHNLQDLSDSSQIRLLPRGVRASPGIPFSRRSHPRSLSYPRDVAWIEVQGEISTKAGLQFIQLDDLAPGTSHRPDQPFFVQGFPAEELLVHSESDLDPMSLGLGTMSVPAECGDDLVVEYPPQSAADIGLELVAPNGISGGGIWTFPRFSDHLVWSAAQMRLVGINRSWLRNRGLLFAEPIGHWLRLVWSDFPELREEVEAKLEPSN